MKAYKGFDKDLKCRGFQYKIGKEYTEDSAIMCEKGFHACEYPLDCFKYYPPANSRYCEVEIDDNGQRRGGDTKVCGTHIKIGAELDVKGLVRAAFEYVKERCSNGKQGGDCSVLQGGNYSALQGGDCSVLQGGCCSALQGGDSSVLQGGVCSALAGGNNSALQGENSAVLRGGDWSALQGGKHSIIYGGEGSKVKGGIWSVLVIQYWVADTFIGLRSKIVDGETIKADTWYKLDKEGNFMECKEG